MKNGTYISIGKDGQNTTVSDVTSQINYYNNLGVSRKRNLELLNMLEATPAQFTKTTTYQDSLFTINPIAIKYNSSTGGLSSADVPAGVVYSNTNNWIINEKYTQFLTAELTPQDSVFVGLEQSNWSSSAYQTVFANAIPNYELKAVGQTGIDYTSSINLSLFKDFTINKYYQFARVSS